MFLSQVATASLPLLLQVGHMNFSAKAAITTSVLYSDKFKEDYNSLKKEML